jgi:hypothetical protein
MDRLRCSRWRHAVVLAPPLAIELALALYFFSRELLGYALPLFVAGVAVTAGAYAVLLRRWALTPGSWSRFALCLACAFAAFQIGLIAFALFTSATQVTGMRVSVPGFVLFVLVGANLLFFPVWLVLGALTYELLRFTEPEPPPRATPPPRGRLRR